MGLKWKKSSQDLKDLFTSLIEGFDKIEKKKMFGYPCAFYRGHLFTGLHEENWILKLSEIDIEKMLKMGAEPFEPMGRAMREYVILPQVVVEDQATLKKWISKSLEFVDTKPIKLSKKKKLN